MTYPHPNIDPPERIDQLATEIGRIIDMSGMESDITYAEAIGILFMEAMDLWQQARDREKEEE